jgi:formylglycine-generating enzyme required for sulfatase activity
MIRGLVLVALSIVAVSAPSDAHAQRILVDCNDCAPLVVIPRGRFQMGSDDGERSRPEGPVHEVRIRRPFALGRYEVTLREFRRFVDATGHVVSPGCRVQGTDIDPRSQRVEWRDDPQASWTQPRFRQTQSEDMPVVCVGRVDALAYAAWLAQRTQKAYRLPSETEWEYAAGAGTRTAFPWGNNPDRGCEYANLYDRTSRKALDFGWSHVDCEDGYAELAPVGKFAANRFGVHDMIGNVWEWTQDCYQLTYDSAPRDGSAVPASAACQQWSVRGGGWMTRPSRQRHAFRGRDPNDAHYSYFGFRVARDLSAAEVRALR